MVLLGQFMEAVLHFSQLALLEEDVVFLRHGKLYNVSIQITPAYLAIK